MRYLTGLFEDRPISLLPTARAPLLVVSALRSAGTVVEAPLCSATLRLNVQCRGVVLVQRQAQHTLTRQTRGGVSQGRCR